MPHVPQEVLLRPQLKASQECKDVLGYGNYYPTQTECRV